jgi:serine/threonine protein kinase
MGEIFLARFEGAAGFEKLFVIKKILPHLASDSRFRAMLISEARIAARMSHANICQVYELDESDHQLYIVMEYLEGITLLALLRKYSRQQRQLELGFVAGVVQQIADGLHYAHELRDRGGELLGIVHRDVTPSNLFLTENGVAKVHDFGVAKAKDSTGTESGAVKGKFAYMAPEQLTGGHVDRRADIFGLGVVAVELVLNRRLFQRKTDYLTFRAVMEQPLPDFRKHRPDLPEELISVLTRALARDPEDRYATVAELATAITGVVGRPWDQSEVRELIRQDFSEELRRHHGEITGVINRSAPRTMPVILESPSDPDAENYAAFEASFERRDTQLSGLGVIGKLRERVQVHWKPLAAGFGAAIVLIAVLYALRAFHGASAPELPHAVATGGLPELYGDAIHARDPELARCMATHPDPLPEGTQAVLRIGVDGHPHKISFMPEPVDRSALGNCLREVLTTTVFPAGDTERELAIAVHR